jgi:hypothetical protein
MLKKNFEALAPTSSATAPTSSAPAPTSPVPATTTPAPTAPAAGLRSRSYKELNHLGHADEVERVLL